MAFKDKWWLISFLLVGTLLLAASCGVESPQGTEEVTPTATVRSPEDEVDPTLTPTPTPTPGSGGLPTLVAASSQCKGLSGEIEVQVLVGPAEAAGLEPVAVGDIPIDVISETPPYVVEGGGIVSYEAVLEKEWGTYAVTMDMEIVVEGECEGTEGEEKLRLRLEMSGEQMVEVEAEGFHGEYPWAGEQEFEVEFPLEDGATVEGEGWAFVLHLGSR